MSVIKDVEKDSADLSKFARAVVAKRVGIVAFVTVLVNLALSYGWVDISLSNDVLHWLNAALTAVGAITAIGITQTAVTPNVDPRNAAGQSLVPIAQVEALVSSTAPATTSDSVVSDLADPAPEVSEPVEKVDDSTPLADVTA